MQARFKLWLEDGEPVFGDGLAALLRAIAEMGSINQASTSLKMSYRQAWGRIRKAEKRLGIRLVETKVGGECGGGASLTVEAGEMLGKYTDFRQKAEIAIDACFHQVFKN